MIATAPQTGYTLDKVEYISAEQVPALFKFCPKRLYMRNQVPSKERIDVMKLSLMFPSINEKDEKSIIVQVLEPIKFFTLTNKQIEDWHLPTDDIVVGERYLLNGNTRVRALIELLNDQKNLVFLDIPIQQILISDESSDLVLLNLQQRFNDTTQEHSALGKIQSIADFIQRNTEAGVADAEINKLCIAIMGVSRGYVSNIRKFINVPEMSDEMISEREDLFEKINLGYLSFDTCVCIMQNAPKFKLSYGAVYDALEEYYKPKHKSGQTLFSKYEVIDWFKKLESGKITQGDTAGSPTSNTKADKNSKTDTPKEKKEISKEDVAIAKDSIGVGVEFVKNELSKIDNNEIANVDENFAYKEANLRLLTILRTVVEYGKPETYQQCFYSISNLITDALATKEFVESVDNAKLLSISRNLKILHNMFTKTDKPEETENDSEESETLELAEVDL